MRDNFGWGNLGGQINNRRPYEIKSRENLACKSFGKRVGDREGSILPPHCWWISRYFIARETPGRICSVDENFRNDQWLEPKAYKKASKSAVKLIIWLLIFCLKKGRLCLLKSFILNNSQTFKLKIDEFSSFLSVVFVINNKHIYLTINYRLNPIDLLNQSFINLNM